MCLCMYIINIIMYCHHDSLCMCVCTRVCLIGFKETSRIEDVVLWTATQNSYLSPSSDAGNQEIVEVTAIDEHAIEMTTIK